MTTRRSRTLPQEKVESDTHSHTHTHAQDMTILCVSLMALQSPAPGEEALGPLECSVAGVPLGHGYRPPCRRLKE